MEPQASDGLWSLLPGSLRTATILAIVTALVAGTLLFRSTSPGESPGTEGDRAGGITNPNFDDLTFTTPTPLPDATGRPRSQAVLTAPDVSEDDPETAEQRSQFPKFGNYVYDVEGTERAGAFGTRQYPPEMTMVVHRTASGEPPPELAGDELVFDLLFSEEHTEREVVAFRRDGVLFTYEAWSVTFGPVSQEMQATYEPAMLQIPFDLEEGEVKKGTSRAISPEGEERRIEDWTITMEGTEELEIMGETVTTTIVNIERRSRPGSADQVTKTRRYWFDRGRSVWVKWEEHTSSTSDFGPSTVSYETNYTATLDRIEPL